MKNQDVRNEIVAAGVRYWQVADELGITDGNFSRKLRRELSNEDKAAIRAAIERLTKEVR